MLKLAIQNVCKITDCVRATTLGHVIFYSVLAVYALSQSFVHVSLHLRVYVLDEDVTMVIRVKKVSLMILFMRDICYAQTMDRDNPWIALLKVWIRALRGRSMD